jgi:hypothetical protein
MGRGRISFAAVAIFSVVGNLSEGNSEFRSVLKGAAFRRSENTLFVKAALAADNLIRVPLTSRASLRHHPHPQ